MILKLWLLTSEFPPYVGGGIGTYCEELVRASAGSDMELTVIVSDWNLEERKVRSEAHGCSVIRFNPHMVCHIEGLHGPAKLAHAFFTIASECLSTDGTPDAIESQDYQSLTYYISQDKLLNRSSKFKNIPICLTIHSPGYVSRQYNDDNIYLLPHFWNDEMERFCISAADARWATSQLLISKLKEEFPNKDFALIRNPIHLSDHHGPEAQDHGIYYYGRIQVLKGVLPLLNAYNDLVKEGFNQPLIMIGGDTTYPAANRPFSEHIQKKFSHLIERGLLQLRGMVPRSEAMGMIAHARTVVIPSFFENYAYTALEMINLQRVVVTSSTCGHSEILANEESGLIFDHSKPGDLTAKLAQSLTMTEEQRQDMAAKAKAAVREASNPAKFLREKKELVAKAKTSLSEADKSIYPFIRPQPRVPSPNDNTFDVETGLLSIVIPFFNLGYVLDEAIESALACEYTPKEVIVLNASSTSAKSISEFYLLKEKYRNVSCIRFEHVPDKGLADTRNQGAQIARGEFLTFHDPDDLVDTKYYSKAIGILTQYENISAVGCWVKYFEGSDGHFISWTPEPPFFLFHNMLNTAGSVFKRRDFLEFGMNDLNMHMGMEDYEAMMSLVESGRGCVVIPEFLFHYRVRADSMMRQLSKKNDIYAYQYIARKHQALFKKYAVEITGLLNANGSGFMHDNPQVAGPFGP